MNFSLILFSFWVVLLPIALLLEKYGMSQVGHINSVGQLFNFHTIFRIVTNPYVVGGVAVSALSLLLWLGVLSNLKVSYIYPFTAVSYIILAVLAYFVLKENITSIHWVGICVIVLGCYLLNK